MAGATLCATWLRGWLKGGDGDGAAERLPRGEDLARLALGGNVAGKDLPVVAEGLHGREAEHVHGAANLIARLPKGQPGFGRDGAGELLAACVEGGPGSVEDFASLVSGWGVAKGQRGTEGLVGLGPSDGLDGAG